MKLFLISYDLDTPGQDYPALINAIKALGGQKVLKSQWIVKVDSRYSAKDICTHLVKYIDANDRMLANDFQDWGAYNLMLDLNRVAA